MSLFPTDSERIEHQKWVADTVLDKLFPIDPNAIVAGGAPRDWQFGKPATDVDVFFYAGANTLGTVSDQLHSIGMEVSLMSSGENLPEWYKLNPELRAVFDTTIEGVEVQIILMRAPTFSSVLPNFPLSICHAWYKHSKIHLEREFLRSVKHKAIYKTSTIYRDESKYITKILAKFPEYTYYQGVEDLAKQLLDK